METPSSHSCDKKTSLIEKKRKQWTAEKEEQKEWFPFGQRTTSKHYSPDHNVFQVTEYVDSAVSCTPSEGSETVSTSNVPRISHAPTVYVTHPVENAQLLSTSMEHSVNCPSVLSCPSSRPADAFWIRCPCCGFKFCVTSVAQNDYDFEPCSRNDLIIASNDATQGSLDCSFRPGSSARYTNDGMLDNEIRHLTEKLDILASKQLESSRNTPDRQRVNFADQKSVEKPENFHRRHLISNMQNIGEVQHRSEIIETTKRDLDKQQEDNRILKQKSEKEDRREMKHTDFEHMQLEERESRRNVEELNKWKKLQTKNDKALALVYSSWEDAKQRAALERKRRIFRHVQSAEKPKLIERPKQRLSYDPYPLVNFDDDLENDRKMSNAFTQFSDSRFLVDQGINSDEIYSESYQLTKNDRLCQEIKKLYKTEKLVGNFSKRSPLSPRNENGSGQDSDPQHKTRNY